MDFDYKWKTNKKRISLRNKLVEKLKLNNYNLNDIGNVTYTIQNYIDERELFPYRMSYDFTFNTLDWEVKLYTYNVGKEEDIYDFYDENEDKLKDMFPNCDCVQNGKFIKDEMGNWMMSDEYRIYLDEIKGKNKYTNYTSIFFPSLLVNNQNNSKFLFKEKMNW